MVARSVSILKNVYSFMSTSFQDTYFFIVTLIINQN